MSDLIPWIAGGVVVCGFLGWLVGNMRGAGPAGLALGALFGPLGVIVAFALDFRSVCTRCRQPHNEGAQVCPYCRAALTADALKDAMADVDVGPRKRRG